MLKRFLSLGRYIYEIYVRGDAGIPVITFREAEPITSSQNIFEKGPLTLPNAERMFERAGVPLDTTFGKLFMSFRMKALKPSEKIYREIISQLGLPAEQLLFIDDSMTNVEASIEAGMPAVHYEPGTDLSALLADVLQWPELASTGAGCVEGKC